MAITKKHTLVNRTKGADKRKYIVIHYTGNQTDTAKANASYFYSTYRGASAHYFVDENSVYEVVSPNDTAWAVGVDYGGNLFGKCTNRNSISIEMCGTNGKVGAKTYAKTVELTKKLMKTYGISAANVVRHYDVCNKMCPGWSGWTGTNQSIWRKFKSDIASAKSSAAPAKPAAVKPAASSGTRYKITADVLNIRKNAGTSNKIVGTVKKGQVYTIVKTTRIGLNTWGKLKSGVGWICLTNYAKKC